MSYPPIAGLLVVLWGGSLNHLQAYRRRTWNHVRWFGLSSLILWMGRLFDRSRSGGRTEDFDALRGFVDAVQAMEPKLPGGETP